MPRNGRANQPPERHAYHDQGKDALAGLDVETVGRQCPELGRDQDAEYPHPDIVGETNFQAGQAEQQESTLD